MGYIHSSSIPVQRRWSSTGRTTPMISPSGVTPTIPYEHPTTPTLLCCVQCCRIIRTMLCSVLQSSRYTQQMNCCNGSLRGGVTEKLENRKSKPEKSGSREAHHTRTQRERTDRREQRARRQVNFVTGVSALHLPSRNGAPVLKAIVLVLLRVLDPGSHDQ